jgi:putative ABC transport system ATP-binding protein
VALIEVRELTKLYRMGSSVVHALDGVNLTIERGEFVAITGPSGSGKSTMMHLLGCLDRPTGGSYLFNGRRVSELSDRELAAVRNKQIGFVFQTFNLINRTSAAENVAVPLFYARQTNTRAPAMRALERVGLAVRSHHNPNELSGGERQRVAIARAIVNDPALLLADEPTGNLDSRTGEQIMDIFRRLNEQGVTIVMVTHEPDIARQAQRIVHMLDGKIVSDRLAAEVIAAEGGARPRKWTSDAAPAAEAPEEEAKPAGPRVLTARLMRGATPGLVCGLIAVGLWIAALATQYVLAATYPDINLQNFDPAKKQIPPFPLVFGGLGACLGMATALVLSILAIVFSVGARKRIKTEPGHWLGGRRALAGMILGWLAVAVPVVGVLIRIVTALTTLK